VDNYFIDIANLVGTRGTCDRGRSGAVIVRDRHILATGYVGSPSGAAHCDDMGHEMEGEHCVRTTHAEINAIVNAAKNGVSTKGGTIYSTMFPCYACAKAIINAGIVEVISDYDYHKSGRSKELFTEVGVSYELIHNEIKAYEKN